MELKIVLGIIFWHWITDFVMQTEWQATNKSKSLYALLCHTMTYSALWFPLCSFGLFSEGSNGHIMILSISFVLITFIFRTLTDYLTSRLNTKLVTKIRKEQIDSFQKDIVDFSPLENFYKSIGKGKWHNFFVSVGFDQVLHYVQLFVTYYLLKS